MRAGKFSEAARAIPAPMRWPSSTDSSWATIKREIRHIWGPWERLTRSQLRTILFE